MRARLAHRAEDAGRDEADRRLGGAIAADADHEVHLAQKVRLQRRDHCRRHGVGDGGDAQRFGRLPLAQLSQGGSNAIGIGARQSEPPHLGQLGHQHDEAGAREGASQRF